MGMVFRQTGRIQPGGMNSLRTFELEKMLLAFSAEKWTFGFPTRSVTNITFLLRLLLITGLLNAVLVLCLAVLHRMRANPKPLGRVYAWSPYWCMWRCCSMRAIASRRALS